MNGKQRAYDVFKPLGACPEALAWMAGMNLKTAIQECVMVTWMDWAAWRFKHDIKQNGERVIDYDDYTRFTTELDDTSGNIVREAAASCEAGDITYREYKQIAYDEWWRVRRERQQYLLNLLEDK